MIVVGLMSGTSVDGIDVALVSIEGSPPQLVVDLLAFETVPWPDEIRQDIFRAFDAESGRDLCRLNFELGEHFASRALRIVTNYNQNQPPQTKTKADLIASHGQTIWHEIEKDGQCHSTIQLGSGSVIAERTGITTVCDFRSRDVAAGGQGAPLVAYFDWLVLRHATKWRAVQNIGGISNVTFLPPLCSQDHPVAFDTGPGNALIDAVVSIASNGHHRYDPDGAIARSGVVHSALLNRLLAHDFYSRKPPKTTGRELFGRNYAQRIWEEGCSLGMAAEEIVSTVTALTAHSIAIAYQNFAPAAVDEAIVGGGGVHNVTLMEQLAKLLQPARILRHEDVGIHSDVKEAVAFAVLAYETWYGRAGNLPSCTGARRAVPLGQIVPGDNYAELLRATWIDNQPEDTQEKR